MAACERNASTWRRLFRQVVREVRGCPWAAKDAGGAWRWQREVAPRRRFFSVEQLELRSRLRRGGGCWPFIVDTGRWHWRHSRSNGERHAGGSLDGWGRRCKFSLCRAGAASARQDSCPVQALMAATKPRSAAASWEITSPCAAH